MDTEILSEQTCRVISQKDAKAIGLKFYFTGKPCHKGHVSKRYVSNFDCVQCHDKPKVPRPIVDLTCKADGCTEKRDAKGFCPKHYNMWKAYGDPLKAPKWNKGERLAWIEAHKNHSGNDCLFWPFGEGRRKYPLVYWYGKSLGVHEVMCSLRNGPKPNLDFQAAHSCGNGGIGCINPSHLRWDTVAGNAADRHVHGTAIVGAKSHFARLTEDQVREIRRLEGLMSQSEIARKFGVERHTIYDIHKRNSWFNLD